MSKKKKQEPSGKLVMSARSQSKDTWEYKDADVTWKDLERITSLTSMIPGIDQLRIDGVPGRTSPLLIHWHDDWGYFPKVQVDATGNHTIQWPGNAGRVIEIDYLVNRDGVVMHLTMCYVGPGRAILGEDKNKRLKNFTEGYFAMKHTLSVDQWRTFVRVTSRECDKNSIDPKLPGNYPVTYVNFFDAEAFGQWAGVRMPTDEEWEYAARGTDGRPYPWGWDEPNNDLLIWSGSGISRDHPEPVDSCPAGASPFGCLNMAGNVWEWTCTPWEEASNRKAIDDPEVPATKFTGAIWSVVIGLSALQTDASSPTSVIEAIVSTRERAMKDVSDTTTTPKEAQPPTRQKKARPTAVRSSNKS